jgi:hypothetical protein
MMKPMLKIAGMLIALTWLAGSLVMPIQAGPPTPRIPPAPPHPPAQPPVQVEAAATPPIHALGVVPLKAVLIVGSIYGANSSWTTHEKANMELAAQELEANGVTVYRFYAPNDNWDQIKAAAQGAHFLFYRGHGVYWSDMPHPIVGGFALSDNVFVSSDMIRSDLKLAPSAIVMLFGCFTAGSADSIDPSPINSTEAQRRVVQYSDPFFDIGVAGYYANWLDDSFQMLVRYLFQGKTLGEAYRAYNDSTNHSIVESYSFPDHPEMAMWLGKNDWSDSGGIVYNNTFVGLADRTLDDLFRVMTLSLSTLGYMAEPSYPARVFTIHVDGVTAFNWTAVVTSADPSWISVQPPSGSSGQDITVVITPTGKAVGTYQASIRIVAATSVLGGEEVQIIPITMRIVDRVRGMYLPMIFK